MVNPDRTFPLLIQQALSKEKKKQAKEDEKIRQAIEGKFGACVNEGLA